MGVVVVAALQDPRKEVLLPFRDLIPTRIALALVEAEQTDLVLGRSARVRARTARGHPPDHPGDRVGVVLRRTRTRPGRVGWSPRRHRAWSSASPPAPPPTDDGPVVIDLTHKTGDPQRERES